MTKRIASRSRRMLGKALVAAAGLLLVSALGVQAQTVQFRIDSRASLAWWQMNPHLGHLWATTCPEESSWQGGSGVSFTKQTKEAGKKPPRVALVHDKESDIPLYPRDAVHPVCTEGVRGQISADDTRSWRGVRGVITVRTNVLTTGMRRRDEFAKDVMGADKYPEIRFRIDSLTAIQPGDTLHAKAVGVFFLNGVEQPMSAPIKAWNEAGGLRVVSQFHVPAQELIETFRMSKWKLGLGVGTNIWRDLHMGIDAVLRQGPSTEAQ